jgi:hypothetical protein
MFSNIISNESSQQQQQIENLFNSSNYFHSTHFVGNHNSTMPHLLPSRLGSALGAIVAYIFIIFGIFGDALIIIAILTKRELRNNLLNIFIVSCQLNDIFNIGFNQFLVGLSYTFMKWHGPYILCEIFVYTSIISTGSLLWHHALISIHRYLIVVCNLNIRYLNMSPKYYVIFSLVLARLIPTLVCIPALIHRNMTVYSAAALRCLLAPRVSGFQNLLIVTINMLIPCLIIIYCFVCIFTRVHRVSKTIRKTIFNNNGTKSLNSNAALEIISNYQKNTSNNKNKLSTVSMLQKPTVIEQNTASLKLNNKLAVATNTRPSPFNSNSNNLNVNSNHTVVATTTTSGGRGSSSTLSSTMISMHREIQISKMFAIIFTVFLFGYLPYGFIRLIDSKNNLHPDVYVLLTVIFIISISISPIIYGLMNNQIRIQCILLLKKIFNCELFKGKGSIILYCASKEEKKGYDKKKKNKNNRKNNSDDDNFVTMDSNKNVNRGESRLSGIGHDLVGIKKETSGADAGVLAVEKAYLLKENRSETFNSSQNNNISVDDSVHFYVNNNKNGSIHSTKPKIVIDLNDDGGIYKGPPGINWK